ncbi:MAG TPA: AtpZ/AtpI family protein [Spirochaetes bacterium]|nr:AtpZ/AtpI family protein [Spirochaetota bacterium]
MRELMNALSLGIQFILIIFLFLGLGYWIDTKVEIGFPVFLILFLFIGFGIAFYILVKSSQSGKYDK